MYHLGSASGKGCNCLIDTLRQVTPGIMCNVAGVRADLENRHRGCHTHITPGDYLSLDYWLDIVELLYKHNQERYAPSARTGLSQRFRVVCVDLTWIGSGDVLPRDATAHTHTTLPIARVNENHFVPLLRLHDLDNNYPRL